VNLSGLAKGEWVASTCQGCTQWCAIQIFVQRRPGGAVRGNPLSKTNHGYVCPRGHMIPQQTYDPDRIKVPMKRTNPPRAAASTRSSCRSPGTRRWTRWPRR
jgi:anaerobic selenocysteine-containing dehydrogenase